MLTSESWAQENSATTINPYANSQKLNRDDLLVLQVNLGRFLILDDPIIGYTIDNQVFLSLKDFIRVLELSVEVAPDNMSAKGWFISEDKKFSLDLRNNKCQANNKKFTTSPNDIILFSGDIFVNTKTLQKWFGLDLDFNKQNQEIGVNSGGLLPIETRFERQKQWQALASTKQQTPNTPEITESLQTPYKLISVPFGNLNYVQNYTKSGPTKTSSSQINGLFTGDFLYLNNQISATVQDNTLSSARITSGRRDSNGELLGPLGATEFSLGDIYTPEQPLIANSAPGKGATISNYPLEYVNQFNKTNVRGNAQVGWDVELYRNDSLFNFQKIGNDGVYEFLDVPLVAGLNIIKLIFYGPFGQQYQETRRFMIGNDLLKEGKIYYRFATNKNNDNLIKNDAQDNSQNPSQGIGRFSGELGYGLTKSTSIVTNFFRIPLNLSDQPHNYTSLSLRSSLLGVAGRLDVAKDLENKSNAQELSLQASFFDYNLSGTFDNFDKDFVSEDNPTLSDPLIHKHSIRIDGPLTIPFMTFPSRVSLTATQDNFASNEFRNDLGGDISFGLSNRISLTQSFQQIDDSRIEGEQRKIVNGRTLLNYIFSEKLNLRSILSYGLQPNENLNSLNVASSYNFANNFNTNFSIDHQFAQESSGTIQPSSTSYSVSVSKTFTKVIVSLGANYVDNGNYGLNLNLSTSFGYDAKHNTGVISGTPLANTGAIAAKVFIDANNNGAFDKGEEAIENVEILVNDGIKRVKTNEDGVAFITNLQFDGPAKVSINTDSLPDPYLVVKQKSTKIFGHSGTISDLDFPVSRIGEISGYTILRKNGDTNPAANVELQLIDEKGDVIATTKSGYDGFYLFEKVPFNKYQLQVSNEQSTRLGFAPSQKYDLELNNQNQMVEKINFNIRYAGEPSVKGVKIKNTKKVKSKTKIKTKIQSKKPKNKKHH